MEHICRLHGIEDLNQSSAEVLTCGGCGCKYHSVCTLHQHLTSHDGGGSYFFDHVVKVAFPKFGSSCKSTQTEESQTNFLKQIDFLRKYRPVVKETSVTQDDHMDYENTNNFNEKLIDSQETFRLLHLTRDVKFLASATDSDQLVVKSVMIENCDSTNVTNMGESKEKLPMSSCSVRLERLPKKPTSSKQLSKHSAGLDFIQEIPKEENRIKDMSDNNCTQDSCHFGVKVNKDFSASADSVKHLQELKTISVANKKKSIWKIAKESDVREGKLHKRIRITDCLARSLKQRTRRNLTLIDTGEENVTNSESKINSDDESHELSNTADLKWENCLEQASVGKYIIQRVTADRPFSRGEKDESNQVRAVDTWVPDSSWIFEGHASDNHSRSLESFHKESSNLNSPLKDSKTVQKLYSAYTCPECGKTIKGKQNVVAHRNKHAGLKPFICEQCGKSYLSISNLHMHLKQVHSETRKWWKCSICDYVSASQVALRRHYTTHNKVYSFTCELCSKCYKAKHLLKMHMQFTHHRKKFRCKNCKHSFDKLEELETHKMTHQSAQCNVCNRVFANFGSLSRHRKIHLDERNHKCHICLRRFLQKTAYWLHMEKHHDLTKAQLINMFPKQHLDKHLQVSKDTG